MPALPARGHQERQQRHPAAPPDVQFSTAGGEPTPEDDVLAHGRGPSGFTTTKTSAGLTGKRALRYAGTQQGGTAAYSYNKVFDVNVGVRHDAELSYRIFPSMADGDRGLRRHERVGGPGVHGRRLSE